MKILFLRVMLLLAFFGYLPVKASHCEEDPKAGGMYCMMEIATGTPDTFQRPKILDTEYVEYCRNDDFDGAEVCVVIAEYHEPLDAEVQFIRAANRAWLINISVYFKNMEQFSKTLEIKVDGGPVRSFRVAVGSRGYYGADSLITVRQLFPVDKELLEAISKAENLVWFRLKQEDGAHKDLKMEASHFSLLNLFISEASSAFGKD